MSLDVGLYHDSVYAGEARKALLTLKEWSQLEIQSLNN